MNQKIHGAVIVTRVSTGEQAKHGTSLESQLDACRQKALSLNLPIIAEFEDAGVSGGFLLQRDGMQAALGLIQTGRADTLICANMTRYSRDVEHQQAIKKAVRATGGRLVFCDMDFDDTPEGDLAFNIMGGFAEYERKVIRERSMKGHQARARQGVQTGRTTAPFGYVIPKKADILRGLYPAEQLGQYILITEQADVVRDLFEKYSAGTHSLNDLSKMLNASGLPTRNGGAFWRASNVRDMLLNPVYKGVGVYGRYEHWTDESRLSKVHPRTGLPLTSPKGNKLADPSTWITWPVPATVSEELWEAANAKLRENKSKRGGNPGRVRMLASRVFCPHCGASCVTLSPTKQQSKRTGETLVYPHRYTCGRYRRTLMEIGKPACVPTGYYVHEVEAAVLECLLQAAQHPQWIEAALAEYRTTRPAEPKADDERARELAGVERALAMLETKQAAAVKAQIAGIMAGAEPTAYDAAFGQIAGERAELERRQAVLEKTAFARPQAAGVTGGREADANSPVSMTGVLADIRQALTSERISGAEKRDLIARIIEQIIPLKPESGTAGARVVFLSGLFGEESNELTSDTLGTSSDVPEIRRLRAGKRQGSGAVPRGNSLTTAPRPLAISLNSLRFSAG